MARAPRVTTRQVFLSTLDQSSAFPFASMAAKSCTCRSNSRTRYEPGVQTGMIRLVSLGTFRFAGTGDLHFHFQQMRPRFGHGNREGNR